MVVPSLDAKGYALCDAVVAGRRQSAFQLLHELSRQQTDPILMMGMLSSAFLEIYRIRLCMDRGMTESQIVSWLGGVSPKRKVFPWRVRRYMETAAGLDKTYLRFAVRRCVEADISLKRSRMDKLAILELFLASLLEYGGRKSRGK